MPDYSSYQKKLISRYYDRRGEIQLTRLQEIVTELFLADSPAKTKRLWSRADKAMETLKVPPKVRQRIVRESNAELLANHIRDWLREAKDDSAKKPGK